jgi:hypothetical protein
MQHTYTGVALLGLASLLGCGGESREGGIDLLEQGGSVSGVHQHVRFSSEQVAPDTFEVRVVVDGLTLFQVLDASVGVAELDGFASANGADTQLRDTDRLALRGLLAELDSLGDLTGSKMYLRRAVGVWADMPKTRPLTLEIVAEQDRSYTSLCSKMNTYVSTTHDCWDYDDWENPTRAYGYLSMEGPVGSQNNAWYRNGAWGYSEPDHKGPSVYIRYNCFGRCGIGCGGDRQFTQDCANHDNCVTMGHDKASFWCDDDWSAAIDDWTFAPSC